MKEAPAVPAPSGGAELGEDMLQMALRMASEMSDEPVMDLETSLEPVAVNTGKILCSHHVQFSVIRTGFHC